MTTNVQPISDPEYWNNRFARAITSNKLFHSIYICRDDVWERIEKQHKKVLKKYIGKDTSILDIGCGYGRLLNLLPNKWEGQYRGIDLCPRFIELAKSTYPEYADRFFVKSVDDIEEVEKYDLAIMISFRPMIIRNMGTETWDRFLTKIQKVCAATLYLEYSEDDQGSFR